MMELIYQTMYEEDEDEDEDVSWDDEDPLPPPPPSRKRHVTAFTRRIKRSSKKGGGPIPVYCSTPHSRVSTPPNSCGVNVKTGKVFYASSKYPTVLGPNATPECFASEEALADMGALKGLPRPTAVVFYHAGAGAVRGVFRFYDEAEGLEPDPEVLSKMARSSPIDPAHPWVGLARTLEAAKFLKAALSSEDTFPERLSATLVVATAMKRRVPYVVLPDVTMEVFSAKRPVVVADDSRPAYTIRPSLLVFRRKYRGTRLTMSAATYGCLDKLVEEATVPPKLVVFTTNDPDGVFAMIDFYESMPDVEDAFCARPWVKLAAAYGAKSFLDCCAE